jgi:hypothetical protein
MAARLPHSRLRPTGRSPHLTPGTAPRAAIRLRRTRPAPWPQGSRRRIATHTRRGPPSPEPSPSPRGESLNTSVIKRTRHVNTRSGIYGASPYLRQRVRKHGTAHSATTAAVYRGFVHTCTKPRTRRPRPATPIPGGRGEPYGRKLERVAPERAEGAGLATRTGRVGPPGTTYARLDGGIPSAAGPDCLARHGHERRHHLSDRTVSRDRRDRRDRRGRHGVRGAHGSGRRPGGH